MAPLSSALRTLRIGLASGCTLFSPYLLSRLAVAAGLYPDIAQTCPGKGGSVPRAHQAITDLLDLRINRYPHFVLLRRIWQLRDNLSAYDSAPMSPLPKNAAQFY
jgi:hypothetical protein